MEAVKVFVRVRPIENQSKNSITICSNNKILSIETHRQIQCQYDHVFGPKATQEEVYSRVKSCIKSALQGYNCTIMAYGQTGSGKSHSMFGLNGGIKCNPGIIPRSIRDIFEGLLAASRKAVVHISFMQVYNEQAYDLYDKHMMPLDVHEKNGSIIVPKLMQYRVSNMEQCLALIDIGLKSRAVRETSMNNASSRSHSILQVIIEQIEQNGVNKIYSKVNFVDLAGSERWGLGHMCNEQKSELTNINSSLHTLGRCIASLAKVSKDRNVDIGRNSLHIPYRDSKLTRILQDSLGGNSKTCLLATINPSILYGDESISTLRFADRAHQVMTHAKVNEKAKSSDSEVAMLREEIDRLQQLLYTNGIPHRQRPGSICEAMKKKSNFLCEEEQEQRDVYSHKKQFYYSVPKMAAEDNEEIFQENADNTKHNPSQNNVFPLHCPSPSTIGIKMEGRGQDQEAVGEGRTGSHGHLSLSHNATCEKIVGMLGSVLILVDAFLTSAATSRIVDKHLTRNNQESVTTPHPHPDSNSFTAPLSIPNISQQNKKHPSSKQDIPNKLSSLINQRKRLKGEHSKSRRSSEGEIKLELENARRKRKQQLQLRNWLLEKEQRSENPLQTMQYNEHFYSY